VHCVTIVAPEPTELLERLVRGRSSAPLTHVERVPARPGESTAWPGWVPDEVRAAFTARGVTAPWRHQSQAAGLLWDGSSVAIATGTASGKSLAYQLPTLARLVSDPQATVLYLAPTKALAADQLRTLLDLGLAGIRPASYDGDTPREEREWIRQHSRFVLANPDMLHHSVLPGHAAWRGFLRRLAYVVVDECHAYRGVFGSHVAHVLRRLRRVATRYGREPVFAFASATVGDPAGTASRLAGVPVTAVTDDTSPRGAVTFALWEPPLLDPRTGVPVTAPTVGAPAGSAPAFAGWGTAVPGAVDPDAALSSAAVPAPRVSGDHGLDVVADAAPVRRSALRETADLLADSVAHGVRTLAFIRSRRGAEVVASMARRSLEEVAPGLGEQVAAYRAGYLREDRRVLERSLLDGSLTGLAATNALELGIDLAGLDAVLLAGYPGTLASLWQQAGRAGRAGRESLCVLVARDDPLDTYLVHHPAALFRRPVEATVLDPANPYVLGPQLACAAAEMGPLTHADLELFGGGPAAATVDGLVAQGSLRQRPTGWYWTRRGRPDVDRRISWSTPAPCTCTRECPTWSTTLTWTTPSRWCTARTPTSPRTRATSPTCRSCRCGPTSTPVRSACSWVMWR
jgi:DEAD/DEAH box helicase domain-containing protein